MAKPAGQPYIVSEQPSGVYYNTNNEAYIPDQNNESFGIPPYSPAVAGQPYNLAVAGQPYNPAVAGQPYNPAVAGQPYNPAVAGQPYNPAMVGQPQVIVVTQAPQPAAPQSFLAYSIFTCICCFWPLGILAIFFSLKSSEASTEGDMDKAKSYGKKASIVSTVALVCGCVIIVVCVAVVLAS